jgi:hypothetical protein
MVGAQNDGASDSIDRGADKFKLADENLRKAGRRDLVDFQHGDATDVPFPDPRELLLREVLP